LDKCGGIPFAFTPAQKTEMQHFGLSDRRGLEQLPAYAAEAAA
jgi:hypothetical protein